MTEEWNSSSITSLPPELLLHTFAHLQAIDLCRAALVCSLWKSVGVTSTLWKRLALNKWKHWKETSLEYEDWRTIYVGRSIKDARMTALLREVRKSPDTRMQARKEMLTMGVEIVDALDALLVRCAAHPLQHLDTRFHATRILAKIHEEICLEKWDALLALPEHERKVEDGAILICLLEYPDLDIEEVYNQLDDLAVQFKTKLQIEGGGTEDPMTTLQLLSDFLFHDLGIHGNVVNYYDPKNSFLNDVLSRKTGLPVSLSVLYAAVARRVGVKIEMVGTPAHFLVKWVSPDGTDVFIDSFGGGKFLTAEQCQQLVQFSVPGLVFQESFLSAIRSDEVWTRMMRNLMERYKVLGHLEKLYSVISVIFRLTRGPREILLRAKTRILNEDYEEAPDDIRLLEDLHVHGIEVLSSRVLDTLQELQSQIVPKVKPPEVKYNIGDVYVHKELGYHAVIVGWDTRCTAPVEWQEQVGVNLLTHGVSQPFYKCFRHTDGRVWSLSYVAQENIAAKSIVQVDHPFIGKYFKRYDPLACRFIPTKEMERRYPSA